MSIQLTASNDIVSRAQALCTQAGCSLRRGIEYWIAAAAELWAIHDDTPVTANASYEAGLAATSSNLNTLLFAVAPLLALRGLWLVEFNAESRQGFIIWGWLFIYWKSFFS